MASATLSRGLLLALVVALCGAAPAAGRFVPGRWTWPLEPIPRVVRSFEPPDSPYGPGHRGVDLAGSLEQPVLSIGDGVVTFAGSVSGRGVVVVDHGGLRSTYQPVLAVVPVGREVVAGQQVGVLELVHSHCLPAVCLHLGVRRGSRYLDPLKLLGPRPVVLKPLHPSGRAVGPAIPRPRLPRPPPAAGSLVAAASVASRAHIGGRWSLVDESIG